VWTGECDLNTLRVDGEIFESGTKKLRIQKHPDTFGQGLNFIEFIPRKFDGRFSSSEKIYEELDNNNMGRVFAKSHGFRFKTV